MKTDDLLDACILPLSSKSHKGSSGRIGILGGSERYTGAPYYAGMAALHVGSDLAFVFCAQEAALAIKSYSPELMVAPVYSAQEFNNQHVDSSTEQQVESLIDNMVSQVVPLLDRMHVVVIGPGLGRCPLVLKATAKIIQQAMERNIFLVIDADGLFLLTQEPFRNILGSYEKVVLTPNVVEYKRLEDANNGDLFQAFPNALVVKKGAQDEIYKNGKKVMTCDEEGGLKRSGGIGDVLAGTLGTFMAWNEIMQDRGTQVDHVWSCWCACYLVKRSTAFAFQQKGRSMTAPDVLNSIWQNVDDRSGTKKKTPQGMFLNSPI
jgi:ATP-dependent NAD(P)H-hydrate dehydratase